MAVNPFDQFDAPAAKTVNPFDQFDAPAPAATAPAQQSDWMGTALRNTALLGRGALDGLAALPLMAADIPIAAANLIHGKDRAAGSGDASYPYRLPSEVWRANQDALFPQPQNSGEKIGQLLTSTLAGAALPAPKSAVPDSFVNPAQAAKQAQAALVSKSQAAGYVVPPATANPTALNSTLETIAGKTSVAQKASARNQDITNRIAKTAVGLNTDAAISPSALSAVRAEAGNAYEPIKQAGTITADATYQQQLGTALAKYNSAAKDFPELAKTELTDIAESVNKPSFSASSAIDATKILRDKADKAFASGDKGTGQGIKSISDALENVIDRNLQQRGPQYADVLQNFRAARQTIAKTYTIEKALNPGSNNVSAAKLAAALKKGAPLSGEMQTAAQFGAAFPRAAQEPTFSMGINHLDTAGPMFSMILGNTPVQKAAGLLLPASRFAAGRYLLSDVGQAGAVPSLQKNVNAQKLYALGTALGYPSR